MDDATWNRLFGFRHAFDDPFTWWFTVGVVVLLVVSGALILILSTTGKVKESQARELRSRFLSWCVLIPLMMIPVLAGAMWTILAVGLLGVFSFREFARVVGIANEYRIVCCVYAGIVAVTFATADHWYGFFAALTPLTALTIAAAAILDERPKGYVHRVALGEWGFLLFGSALGHLGYLANDADYRPMLLLLVLCVEMNDVFAYCCGKLFGSRKLAPQTSPNKTLGGSLGALVLTTLLFALCGRFVFRDTVLAQPGHLIALGIIISLLGQLGDLMLSSVKRDVGVKDMGTLIPGHGGLLDRFDSLLLVGPAFFHYVNYFRGIGLDQTMRIITG